jgi:ribonuclease BN (tRNA processing enzyme)
MGGPPEYNGLAGPGTLVRYGDDTNNCSAVKMQFDAGRGTTMRLSQLGIIPAQINAVFFTHMHSDHVDGFADLMQLRWHFDSKGPKVDVVCTSDTVSALGFTISCQKFIAHLADSYVQSGEIAQRLSESKDRLQGGPAELVRLMTFEAMSALCQKRTWQLIRSPRRRAAGDGEARRGRARIIAPKKVDSDLIFHYLRTRSYRLGFVCPLWVKSRHNLQVR